MFASGFGLKLLVFRRLTGTVLTAGVAQLVRAPVCGTGGRRSKPVTRPISSRMLRRNSVHRILSKMIVCWYRNEEADDSAGVAELVDALVLGTSGESRGFESLRPHHLIDKLRELARAAIRPIRWWQLPG